MFSFVLVIPLFASAMAMMGGGGGDHQHMMKHEGMGPHKMNHEGMPCSLDSNGCSTILCSIYCVVKGKSAGGCCGKDKSNCAGFCYCFEDPWAYRCYKCDV